MFPRDEDALRTIYDGRWDIPPNPVTWAFVRYLAAPIAVRRHAEAGALPGIRRRLPDLRREELQDDVFAEGEPPRRHRWGW